MTPLPDGSTPPEWAVAKVEAALNVGLSVPEIEKLLVAKGMSPSMAAGVVSKKRQEKARKGVCAK
jgi:hypothetical protein